MKLSAAAELAIRGILVLAEQYGQGPVTLDTVCAKRNLPKQYLTKIFASLARSGLVMPVRGKGGGYMLGREPRQISLLDVIESVEGPVAMNYCQAYPSQCQEVECRMRPIWSDLQSVVREKLSSTKLSECIKA